MKVLKVAMQMYSFIELTFVLLNFLQFFKRFFEVLKTSNYLPKTISQFVSFIWNNIKSSQTFKLIKWTETGHDFDLCATLASWNQLLVINDTVFLAWDIVHM